LTFLEEEKKMWVGPFRSRHLSESGAGLEVKVKKPFWKNFMISH